MNARRFVTMMVLVLPLLVMGTDRVTAQLAPSSRQGYMEPATFEVTFPFMVGARTLPAGRYDVEALTQDTLVFRPVAGAPVEVPVITRLAQPPTPLADPKVIFDKVGDRFYASEVWVPGRDGFLVRGTAEAHSHQTVKGSKKKM